MRERTTIKKVPRHFEDVFSVIWKKAGPHEFIWNYIKVDINRGSMVIKQLSNSGYIVDCGRVGCNQYGNTKKWKLSQDISQACTRQWGGGADGVESGKAIIEYREETDRRYSYQNLQVNRKMVRFGYAEQQALTQIAGIRGTGEWMRHEMIEKGINITQGQLKRLHNDKIIESVGRGKGNHKSANVWKITEKTIEGLKCQS